MSHMISYTISIIHTCSMWGTLLDVARTSASYDDVAEKTAAETIAHTVMGMGPDDNTVCIWRGAMQSVAPAVALQAVAVVGKVADKNGRVVWKEEQKESDGGWKTGLFNTGSLFAKVKQGKWYSYELDKILVQENTMTSGWHTVLTRQLVMIYPGATKGWARVWLFGPPLGLKKPAKSIASAVSRPTIRKIGAWFADVDKYAPAHDGLQNFRRAATSKQQDLVRVVITYPGDVIYVPIGRMHNVLEMKVPTATAYSKLCVSGGLGIAHKDDLLRMRYVSSNNPRLGRSRIKMSHELTRLASLLGSHVPASVSSRGKGQRVTTSRMKKMNDSKKKNDKMRTRQQIDRQKHGKTGKKRKQETDSQPRESTESKKTKSMRRSIQTSGRKKLNQ